jgi:hypothetical protein
MNLLDENITAPEREKLRRLKIPFKQIAKEVGRQGLKDANELLPLLHRLKGTTFFSRDINFYRVAWRHRNYALVYLDVRANEVGKYIYWFLKHSQFNTKVKRMGKVIRVEYSGIHCWKIGKSERLNFTWERPIKH